MTAFDFLEPVPLELSMQLQERSSHIIGNKIKIHNALTGMPDLNNVDIAFVTVNEDRGRLNNIKNINYSNFRRCFYELFLGPWTVEIADLGIISKGDTLSETISQVSILAEALMKKNIIPLILGNTQSLTYGLYRAYDLIKNGVSIVSVDSKFDFSTSKELVSDKTYMSKIIKAEPLNLFGYTNVGYQSYYTSQEEIDLLDTMLFEAYRLGNVSQNIKIVESIFRNADLVSLDLFNSTRAIDLGLTNQGLCTGFEAKEICSICRYVGIGDYVSSFGIFEIPESPLSSALVAQMLWYFIEGRNYRDKEVVNIESSYFEKYTVALDSYDINFYKSNKTDRWWIEFPEYSINNNRAIFPCTYNDYQQASTNILPQLWYNIHRRLAIFQFNS